MDEEEVKTRKSQMKVGKYRDSSQAAACKEEEEKHRRGGRRKESRKTGSKMKVGTSHSVPRGREGRRKRAGRDEGRYQPQRTKRKRRLDEEE